MLRNPASGLLRIGRKLKKWQWRHKLLACRHRQIVLTFFLFLLSSLLTAPSFMSISSQVLELWQFPFTRISPEIRKSEITPSEFCPISGDWSKLGIPNLGLTSLMKWWNVTEWCKMPGLQLLQFLSYYGKTNRGEEEGISLPSPPPTQIRVNEIVWALHVAFLIFFSNFWYVSNLWSLIYDLVNVFIFNYP